MKLRNTMAVLSMICIIFTMTACGETKKEVSGPTKIYIDDEEFVCDVQPEIIDGIIMLPIENIAEYMETEVLSENETDFVTFKRSGIINQLVIGSDKIEEAYGIEKLDMAPIKKDGEMLVSAQTAEFVLGADVIWRQKNNEVYIFSNAHSGFWGKSKIMADDFDSGMYGEELFYLYDRYYDDIMIYSENNQMYIKVIQECGRYKLRKLKDKELRELKKLIKSEKIEELDDYMNPSVDDGDESMYIHLTDEKMSQLYMYGVFGEENTQQYTKLIMYFRELSETGEYEIHYDGEEKLDGFEVVVKNEDYYVKTPWKNGDDLRTLVIEEKSIGMHVEEEKIRWYSVGEKGVKSVIDEPEELDIRNAFDDIPEHDVDVEIPKIDRKYQFNIRAIEHFNTYPWRCTWNGKQVRLLNSSDGDEYDGLYLTEKGKEPILIQQGSSCFAGMTIVPGSNWVVCAKAEKGWENPSILVKINLNTFEEYIVEIPDVSDLEPVSVCENRVLICGYDLNKGTENISSYFWYDPVTDIIEKSEGDVKILDQCRERFLQKTANKNEYYCVENHGYDEPTTVGIFNTRTMKFTPIAEYDFDFYSMDMWVDDESGFVYAAVNGDLLKLPFKR